MRGSTTSSTTNTGPKAAGPKAAGLKTAGAKEPRAAIDYALLARTPLFAGVAEGEVSSMLACLEARRLTFRKGEAVLRTGDRVRAMGVVLAGSVIVERVDVWGTRSILSRADAGETFAEAFACSPAGTADADVIAAADCELLLLDVDRVMRTCTSACAFHARLVRNLLSVMAERNLRLARKITDISPHTIRNRVMSYLAGETASQGTTRFLIPYTRQQLADYLCVDRSALSHELSKMRDEGLIGFDGNRFWLV